MKGRGAEEMISGINVGIREESRKDHTEEEGVMVRKIWLRRKSVAPVGVCTRRGDRRGWKTLESWMEKGRNIIFNSVF